MNIKKTALSIAFASIFNAGNVQADIVSMNYDGLYTLLDTSGSVVRNGNPYYNDPTWGYGLRTQISGTMQFNTDTGAGSATVNPFNFLDGGPAIISDFQLQSVSGQENLLIGNMQFSWGGNDISVQIVLDGSGLFSGLIGGTSVGTVYDQAACSAGLLCTVPASDAGNSSVNKYPVGPAPISTSSFNVAGSNGLNDPTGISSHNLTTINMLSLGSDDSIGGSPMDNGPFSTLNINLDFTSLTVTSVVPVPAAVWLFGSGLLGLAGVARRRKMVKR